MINQQIDSIIALRRPRVAELTSKNDSLSILADSLQSLREFLNANERRILPEKLSTYQRFLPDLASLVLDARQQQAEIGKLITRFQRDRLNVGIVGMAKQGKSTFLISLSGLDEAVIPAGTNFTTGAASKIHNDASVVKGEEYAYVTFHTPETFLRDVVHPLWSDTGVLKGTIPQPSSLDEFALLTIPDSGPNATDAKAKSLLDELRAIQGEIGAYRSFLGATKKRVSRSEIRSYVAQHDINGQPISTWRAVMLVEIYCAFPNTDVEKITLLDTPGLGQVTVGLEAYIKEVMGSEMDLAIMVVNPAPGGPVVTEPFLNLYSLLDRSLADLRLEEWAALAINKTPHNESVINVFDSDLARHRALSFKAGNSHVSCKSSEETQTFFGNCLTYISENCQRLDDLYLQSRLQSLKQIHDRAVELHREIRNAFPSQEENTQEIDTYFDTEFGKLWRKISGLLKPIVRKYRAALTEQNPYQEIEIAIHELDQNLDKTEQSFNDPNEPSIPTVNEIKNFAEGVQVWSGIQAQALLTQLGSAFGCLDVPLQESFRRIRDEFWQALTQPNVEGNLSHAPELREIGDKDIDERIKELAALFGKVPDAQHLAEYFNRASEIYPSYDIFWKYKLRQCLKPLDQEEDEYKLEYVGPFLGSAEHVRNALINAWKVSREDALVNLRTGFAEELRQAEFAYAEEMVNNLLLLDGVDKARQRMERFTRKYRKKIWPSHYKTVETDLLFQDGFEDHLRKLNAAMQGIA